MDVLKDMFAFHNDIFLKGERKYLGTLIIFYSLYTEIQIQNIQDSDLHISVCLFCSFSECLKEVWKGDVGVKGPTVESESEPEEDGQTHDAGEL